MTIETRPPDQRRIVVTASGPFDRLLLDSGIALGRPVVVLIGGAAKLDESAGDLRAAVRDGVLATAQADGATVVDGGTDSGVMALAGQARAELDATIPLIGVAPIGRVAADGIAAAKGTTALEPNHTHVLLAPGDEWGTEAPWLVNTARIVAGTRNVVAVLIDGGPLALQEAMACAAQGWPLLTVAGTGRTADVLAAYARGSDDRRLAPTHRGAIHVVELSAGPAALAQILMTLLRGGKPPESHVDRTDTPERIEYPALYVVASEASKRGQNNFKRLSALELGLTLFALVLSLAGGSVNSLLAPPLEVREAIDNGVAGFSALAFLLALLIRFLNHSAGYDDDWFTGRSIAETVKGVSWRYMMRVPPYQGDDAERQLTAELTSLVDASAGIRQAVDRLPDRPQQISASMAEVHQREFTDRRDFYVLRRLLDQAHWYRRRSAEHRRSATRWFWTAVIFQTLAVVVALLALVAAVYGFAPFQAPLLRGMSLLASIAIAVTAWTQLSRDDELAKTYAVSLQDLLLIASSAERATTEEALAEVVRDGEEQIGRENRVWVAKRAERVESPEFGRSD